jgi:cyclopropane-fatty-acyl-phospholipid synthase
MLWQDYLLVPMGVMVMRRSRQAVTNLLAQAGIRVNGDDSWDIQVVDDGFYGRVLRDGSLGLGESYMEGWWECDRLDELFRRICSVGLDQNGQGRVRLLLEWARETLLNRQTRRRCLDVAERHYNLGDDMFLPWLDRYNQYSCAYFDGTDDLDQAQEKKLDLICRKIGLRPGHKVLDVGCGWGGFCRFAAERYGCSVEGVNISSSQIEYARRSTQDLGLDVAITCRDYRDLVGTFDKIVSVGMFEHVGHKNYRVFMRSVHRCLREAGVLLLHTIGSNVTCRKFDPWIRKYIFPNGMLPSLAQISRAAEGLFVVEDVHNLGPHYDTTLMAWNERFQAAWPDLRQRYPETFKRMWEYYLLCCAGAFRARAMQVWQIVLTKPGRPQPFCRV